MNGKLQLLLRKKHHLQRWESEILDNLGTGCKSEIRGWQREKRECIKGIAAVDKLILKVMTQASKDKAMKVKAEPKPKKLKERPHARMWGG